MIKTSLSIHKSISEEFSYKQEETKNELLQKLVVNDEEIKNLEMKIVWSRWVMVWKATWISILITIEVLILIAISNQNSLFDNKNNNKQW